MRKGFLCGPPPSASPSKKDTKKVEEKKTENVQPSKPTGAIPKTNTVAAPVPGKRRRRTRSLGSSLSPSPGRGFFVPGFTNNTSSSMSLSELMDASKGVRGMTNMALAHEIAVDKNFELSKIQPENELEKQIKEVMQRAFWDILKEQLEQDPPVYSQALQLFMEVKTMLYSILLPQHEKLKEKIESILDLEVIKQQIDANVLEFGQYAGYILGVMGMLCAPVRDEQIAALKQETDVVKVFKGIMETLETMKLDMANFTIQTIRPTIEKESKEYEKKKFAEFLETQEDGLVSTRQWLVRHAPSQAEIEDPKYKKLLAARILHESYVEILEWDDYYPLPETLVMDTKRIIALRDRVERTAVSTAVILISFSQLSTFIIPMDSQAVKEKLKKHIDILLQDYYEDNDLLKILPSVAVQVVKEVNDYLTEKKKPALTEETVKSLTEQIESVEDPNQVCCLTSFFLFVHILYSPQRIRDLIQKRIIDFCKQLISNTNKTIPQVKSN